MWWQLRKWPSASWVDLEANIQEWIKTKPSEIDLKEQYQRNCSCYTCVDFRRENFIYPSYINENRTCQCIWFLLPWQETQCSNFVPDQSCKEHTCTFQRVVAASQCCKYPIKNCIYCLILIEISNICTFGTSLTHLADSVSLTNKQ